jgi:hypothetical protein
MIDLPVFERVQSSPRIRPGNVVAYVLWHWKVLAPFDGGDNMSRIFLTN